MNDILYRVEWTLGVRQTKWFTDKFDAQEFVIELQGKGCNPRVRKSSREDRNRILRNFHTGDEE